MPKFKIGERVGFNKNARGHGSMTGTILEISNLMNSNVREYSYRVSLRDRQWGMWYPESALFIKMNPNDIMKELL